MIEVGTKCIGSMDYEVNLTNRHDTEHLGFQIPDWLGVLWSNITKDLPKHAS